MSASLDVWHVAFSSEHVELIWSSVNDPVDRGSSLKK
jgi:hypothetical protein